MSSKNGCRCDPEMAEPKVLRVRGRRSLRLDAAVQRRVDDLWREAACNNNTPLAILVVKLNAVQVLALSCLGVVLGVALRTLKLLNRLNIPASSSGEPQCTLRSPSRCVSGT